MRTRRRRRRNVLSFRFLSLSPSSKRLETSDKARIGSKKIIVERIVGIDLSDEGGVKKKKRKSV